MKFINSMLSFIFISACLLIIAAAEPDATPLVDLGYEIHQGTYNVRPPFSQILQHPNSHNPPSSTPPSPQTPETNPKLTPTKSTAKYYNFTNIRYAAPPLSANRFSAPVPPLFNPEINDGGTVSIKCPAATPNWIYVAGLWLTTGLSSLDIEAGYQPPNITTLPPPEAGVSEDCLFLDVLVPEGIFERKGEVGFKGAPV